MQLVLRQCPANMFGDFSIDGSNINDAFKDGGKRDQASARRQHMTVKGDEIASFLVPAERRHRAPQPPDTFDRAASDLLSEQTRLLILYWNPSPKRGSPGAIENHTGCFLG